MVRRRLNKCWQYLGSIENKCLVTPIIKSNGLTYNCFVNFHFVLNKAQIDHAMKKKYYAYAVFAKTIHNNTKDLWLKICIWNH